MTDQPGCSCSICDDDYQESSVSESEYAERTPTQSDPHTYYCAECRTTYTVQHRSDLGCRRMGTCSRVQRFVMAHRENHDADTKRIQVNAPVNIRSAEKLGLVDDARESAAPLRVDLPCSQRGCDCSICDTVGEPMSDKPPLPDIDLRTRIASAIQTRWSELTLTDTWDENCLILADAVIEALSLRREWGALDDNDEGVLADTREELKPWGAETVKGRWITDWQEAEET